MKWLAMKIMDKEEILKRDRLAEVYRERNLLACLRHERLCNSYYAFQDPKRSVARTCTTKLTVVEHMAESIW